MNLFEDNGVEFSPCNTYRYKLWRIWDKALPKAMCIGLNPSTASATKNDATIGILCRMLRKLGYGGFYMMNLFAFISSKPEKLLACDDPMGENKGKLKEVAELCDDVIFCWGAFSETYGVEDGIIEEYPNAKCFGVNAKGKPFHPLAMMYNGTQHSPKLIKYSEKTHP